MEQLNLQLTLNKAGSITASWSKITGAVRYHAYMYIVGASYSIYNETNLVTTSYTSVDELEANKQYKVIVAAYNSSGMTIVSESKIILIGADFYNDTPLPIPQNIKAVSSAITVTITFDKVSRASSYDILFNGTVYNVTETTKKITGLNPKTSYTYAVRAKNANKTGEYSTAKTIMTLPQSPAIPANIKKVSTEYSATISWGAVSGASSYDIIFNGTNYNMTATSRTFTGLTAGTSYNFQVRSKNADASSEYSSLLAVTTAPKPPTNVKATSNEDSITLSWSAATGATGYIIKLNGDEIHAIGSPCKLSGLTANTAYTYQVCSKSADGSGSYSFITTQKTSPKTPTIADATAAKNSVTLKWKEVAGATSYDVLIDDKTYNVSVTSKTITGLTPGTSYTYSIRANNSYGSSSYCDTQTITTLSKVPNVPTGISKTSTEYTATVSWDAVTGATSYNVLFNDTSYSLTGTSKTFTGLSPNTSYTYQVCAKDADGSGTYSTKQTVTTTPKAPASSSVTSNENSVTVSWGAVEGATGYDVIFNGTTYHVTGTSTTLTGLTANTAYPYQISAKNADGSSSYSITKTVKTAPIPPANPTAAPTQNSVTISWGAVLGATSYDVLFNGTPYKVNGTSKTISGLTPGTSYSYSVRANNADSSSSYSEPQIIITIPNPPAVPVNISATATTNSSTVSWSAAAGATSYDVNFNGMIYNVTSTSKTVTGLTPGSSYSYMVRARNAGGTSAYSSWHTIQTIPTAPVTPANVNAAATNNTVTVSWSTVSGATSYDVSFNGTIYNVTGSSKTITGLTGNTNYSFAVRAKNAGGASAYSAAKTIRTLVNPPAVPTNVRASATASSVTVSWNTVSGATSYFVSLNNKINNATGTSITISGLSSDTNYNYAVQASNAGGDSAYSSVQTIRTPAIPPAVPINVSADSTSNSVTVSWSAVSGAASYDVSFNGTVYNVSGTFTTISGLAANTSYSYAVRAKNSAGSSAYSETQKILTLPNPPAVPKDVSATATTDSVTVRWSASAGAADYDVLFDGKIYNAADTSITISGLTSGTEYTYSVRANNTGGSSAYSTPMIIQTIQTIPAVPTGISADPTADTVLLGWNLVTGAKSYDVQFNGNIYNVTNTYETITGLTANTNYTYAVCAKNEAGTSAYSLEKTVRTLLDIPTDIIAEAMIESVTISWGAVAGAESYDVKFNGMTYTVSDTYIEFAGLKPETSYSYSISAKNSEIYSLYSKTNIVKTLRDAPAEPSDIDAIATLNSVIVSWSPVPDATNYDIEFDGTIYNVVTGTARMFSALRVKASNTPRIYKVFSGLRPNTKHTYCARANNENGSSDYTPPKTIFTQLGKYSGLPNVKPNGTYPDGKAAYMGMDPVNALTGAFLWSYTYLEDYGKDSLHFTVMYDSQRDEHSKILGKKWTYSLNYLLYMDSEYAYFSTPYDEVIPFSIDADNGSFQSVDGMQSGYTMGRLDNQSYYVRDTDGMEYIFDSSLCLSKMIEGGLITYQFHADNERQITQIEGRHGGCLTLTYDNGHIASVTDAMGNTVLFAYEKDYLISAVNPEGNGMSFSYDDSGNLLEITDFTGKGLVANRYDIRSRVIAQNTAGRGESYASYDEINKVTTFTDELGNATRYYYDEKLHVTCVELDGIGLQSKYNDRGQLIEQIDELCNSTQMAYDDYGRMNHIIYPDGAEEQIFYNDRNHPIRMINRDGTESLYEYDTRNNLISAQDERGNKSSYSYSNEDDLISYTDRTGHTWAYIYDDNHHLKQVTDPEGNIYKYSHDAIGRMLSFTSPIGAATTYKYSATGDLLQIADSDGTMMFDYNENGNNTGVTDRMGNKQRLEYNELGLVSLATDFMGNEYHFIYDQRGNLIKEIDSMGYSQEYKYDAMGNCTVWTDKNGGTTNYSFNAINQLTEVRDAADNLIKYAYDTMGQVRTVTDALNYQTDYSYDTMGRIISVTNALGDSVSYTYDQAGNLLSKTDENGVVIEYAYDKENRLISSKSDLGTVHFTYDKLGRVIAVQDTDSHTEITQYDGEGNRTAFSDKEGNKTTYAYDKSGRLSEETDPDGNKTSYEYSPNGNCIKITDAAGNEYLYEYDANNRMTEATDPLGHKTSYEYDSLGNVISLTDARGGITSYEYDGNGNLVREINPVGGVMTYLYDKLNRMTEAADEDGNKRSFVYDANGNMTSYTDANQNKWIYEYNAVNNLTSMTDQNGGQLVFSYTKTGKIEKVIDQEGAETSYCYDSMNRLIEMSDALENSLSWTYDSLGRILTQTDACGNITEYEYSPLGSLLSVKDPEGHAVTYTYNALGQILTETNALGHVVSYEYDSLGQVTSITDAMDDKTSFTYTVNGEIATVTDANGGITYYQYDACGNLIQTTDALGNIVNYEYDAMNNQIKECLSTSLEQTGTTIYQYDKKGRMIREINAMSDEKEYTYDSNGNIVTILDEDKNSTTVRYDLNNKPVGMCYSDGREAAFRYNKRGELVELRDWNGTVSMEYGRTGRLAKVTDHNERTTGYGYDPNGNITGIDYPDGSTVQYTYDKNNRMAEVTDAEGKITRYGYDPAGNILSICQPGSTSAFTYNAKGLPVQVKYHLADGTFMENSFSYDALGNIINEERAGSSAELAGSAAYTYDALGQLLSYREGQVTEAYGYNSLGSRISKKVNGSLTATCQYNALNQLTAKTENGIQYSYGYDKRGNLTEERCAGSLARQYTYDAANHMVMGHNLESRESTEYSYNALYMRIKNVQTLQNRPTGYWNYSEAAEEGGRPDAFRTRETAYVTDYLSGANNELMSYEKGYGAARVTYGRGYERLSQKTTLQPGAPETPRAAIASETIGKSYFQTDLLGSTLFSTNEQGESLRYSKRGAWGRLSIPVQEDLNFADVEKSTLFTSYCYDPVIDKYFAQARFYDADQGRMLARDPVKRGLNPYPYCRNNPVNYVDPTGEVANVLVGGAIGGFLGGLTGGIFGFAGSVLSQAGDGEKFSYRKAFGSAANGAVVGAVRGALVSSGVGVLGSLVPNFVAGAVGSSWEQSINKGSIDLGESVTSGLINTVSGAIYGKNPLESGKTAFRKGALSGAATSALNNLSNVWGSQNAANGGEPGSGNSAGTAGWTGISPYARGRDPRTLCGTPGPFSSRIGYGPGHGYQYGNRHGGGGAGRPGGTKQGGFSLTDFAKDVAIGAVMGGLGSLFFYGADKKVGSIRNSIRSTRGGNKGGSQAPRTYEPGRPTSGQGFSDRGYKPQLGERTFDGYVNNNVSKNAEVSLYTDAKGFNNIGNAGGEFKRFGTVPGRHGIDGPHVHQPIRNVNPNTGDVRGGVFNPKKGVGVDIPNRTDIKHLYQYLVNGKYQ